MRTKDLVRISVIAVLHLLFCVSHVCSTKKNNDLLLGPAPAKTNATLIGLKKNNQKRAPEGPIKLQVLGKPKKNPKPGPEPKKDTVSKRQAAEAEKTSTERVFREFSDIDVDFERQHGDGEDSNKKRNERKSNSNKKKKRKNKKKKKKKRRKEQKNNDKKQHRNYYGAKDAGNMEEWQQCTTESSVTQLTMSGEEEDGSGNKHISTEKGRDSEESVAFALEDVYAAKRGKGSCCEKEDPCLPICTDKPYDSLPLCTPSAAPSEGAAGGGTSGPGGPAAAGATAGPGAFSVSGSGGGGGGPGASGGPGANGPTTPMVPGMVFPPIDIMGMFSAPTTTIEQGAMPMFLDSRFHGGRLNGWGKVGMGYSMPFPGVLPGRTPMTVLVPQAAYSNLPKVNSNNNNNNKNANKANKSADSSNSPILKKKERPPAKVQGPPPPMEPDTSGSSAKSPHKGSSRHSPLRSMMPPPFPGYPIPMAMPGMPPGFMGMPMPWPDQRLLRSQQQGQFRPPGPMMMPMPPMMHPVQFAQMQQIVQQHLKAMEKKKRRGPSKLIHSPYSGFPSV